MKLPLLLVFAMAAWVEALCPLCGTVGKLPNWWDYAAPGQNGKTCKEVYVALNSVDPGSSTCQSIQSAAGNFCCGSTQPSSGQSGGGSTYKYTGPYGDQPDCPICRDKSIFPSADKATEIISARYVGTFSCATLYYRGINGMTPRDMCLALQGYAWTVCGCDKGSKPPSSGGTSTNTNSGSGSKPSPAPPPTTSSAYNRKSRPQSNRKRLRTGRGGSAGGN